MLGALALLAALIIFVGARNLFSKEETFLLYFDETVNGLAVGAPVKFKGVPIGRVSDLRIRYNQPAWSTAIPVFVEIDTRRLSKELGVDVDLGDEEILAAEIRDGLRGKLVVTSYISGQLYIELDYFNTPAPKDFPYQQTIEYKEIPTEPSVLAQVGSSASDIVARLTAIDMKSINDETLRLLRNTNETLEALDLPKLNREVVGVTERINRTLDETDIPALVEEATKALASVRSLAKHVEDQVDPAMAGYTATVERLNGTLATIDSAAQHLDTALQPRSDFYYELSQTLREVRSAARELSELADYLERNPNALISGRDKPNR